MRRRLLLWLPLSLTAVVYPSTFSPLPTHPLLSTRAGNQQKIERRLRTIYCALRSGSERTEIAWLRAADCSLEKSFSVWEWAIRTKREWSTSDRLWNWSGCSWRWRDRNLFCISSTFTSNETGLPHEKKREKYHIHSKIMEIKTISACRLDHMAWFAKEWAGLRWLHARPTRSKFRGAKNLTWS